MEFSHHPEIRLKFPELAAGVLYVEGIRTDVDVGAHEEVVMQGGRVHLAGRVSRGNVPCALTRVDVVLKAGERTVPIGSLVTDYRGDYAGAITLPFSVPVGDYDLSVVPQNTDCQW